jgi:hypothetical protein
LTSACSKAAPSASSGDCGAMPPSNLDRRGNHGQSDRTDLRERGRRAFDSASGSSVPKRHAACRYRRPLLAARRCSVGSESLRRGPACPRIASPPTLFRAHLCRSRLLRRNGLPDQPGAGRDHGPRSGQISFAAQQRRRVVHGSFSWLSRNRRLWMDAETMVATRHTASAD